MVKFKDMDVTKIIELMTDDGALYRRLSADSWEKLYGASWEPLYHLEEELEEAYQKFLNERKVNEK
jgi:hypothetical protein